MASKGPYYDDLEIRDPEAREHALFATLPDQIAHAKTNAPYFSALFQDVDAAAVANRAALAALPVTRKSDLIEHQNRAYPFGGLTAVPDHELARLFQSPGPIYDPEGFGPDYWRFARALFAAGLRAGDIIHNSFSYHLTPAGFMVESGAQVLGCAVIPAGVGQTELQLKVIADIKPTAYAGTPSFLKILLEKGRDLGLDTSSLTKAGVAGEALPPSLRAEIASFGVNVVQSFGTADLGLIAYESEALEGLIIDEGVIVEIVEPLGQRPVAQGEVGEVVVTTFCREYPLIRFATDDLSALMPGISPCGRTNQRMRGWLGRADQSVKVRGLFVHPNQVMEVLRRFPDVVKVRLIVEQDKGADVMALHCETKALHPILESGITEAVQDICKLQGRVVLVAPGELADDGKIIEDRRAFV